MISLNDVFAHEIRNMRYETMNVKNETLISIMVQIKIWNMGLCTWNTNAKHETVGKK